MALAIFGYFLGFLSNLFKAVESAPFIVPSPDLDTAYSGLLDWEHLKLAFAVVGIILLIILFVVVKGRFESRNHDDRNFSVSEKGTYGTAAYLSEKQARKLLTADNEHSLLTVSRIFGSENGIILGTFPNGHIVTKRAIEKENMNMFVCGAPGSGKSYMFVRPFIAQCVRREESFVCTDPSGELLETMGGYAKACGYKVKVFNLVDPEKSDSWNVTGEVGINQMHAQIAVSTIIKNTLEGERPDPFWDNGEKNLLKALLLYINSDAYTGNKSLGELYKLLASDHFASETLECLKNLPENHPAKLSYNIYAQATESVQQSFASGLATRLQIFQSEDIKGTISVVKVDEKTRKPLSGAEFTIYDSNGNPVKTTTTETGTVITDANGVADFGELRYGTYIVKESKAPENYELDDTPIPFQVLENGKVIEYEKGDPAEEGKLEIIKQSEDGVIENIKFHLYGTSANGTEIDETVLTDKNGKFLIENLLIGTYTVEELEIADRYIKTAPQTVVVSANETASVTFENILKRGKVTTTKIDKDYPDNKLTGAIFEVYDSEGNAVDTLKEITEGVYELDGLTAGNYTLKETKAPDGFDLDENAYPFEITENGDVRNIETLAGVGFINNPQKGDLVISKRSSDKKLEGFSFRITGKAVTGQEYDQIFKTDAEGKITVKDLRVGTYTVSEIADETNVRYNLPDDQTVEIKSKEVTEVEMYNDEKVIPFEITKSDISTGELIPGCGFRIRNSDGEIVIEGYTDENGIAKFELVCGDYTYQEFDAPQGYIIDEKEYPFTINPDDTVVKAEMKNTGTGTVEITKTDISNGALIPDCGFEILDENKKVIRQGRTDKNGVVRFDSLPYGKYYYREFDAPDGYVLDETPFEFEVKKNGEIIKATMTNKPVEIKPGYITTDTPKNPGKVTTPQTGDDSNTMAAVISIICLISVAGIFFTRKSRKKDNED